MINEEKMITLLRRAEFSALEDSKDPSTKVCAIILDKDDYTPRTWGFNGMPRKADETKLERWERPEKYKWVEHAERNAIANAAKVGTALAGSSIVINMFPCIECARMIVQCGIKHVITVTPDMTIEANKRWEGDFERSRQLFAECDVELHTIDEHRLNFDPIREMAIRKSPNLTRNSDDNNDSNDSNDGGKYLGAAIVKVPKKLKA